MIKVKSVHAKATPDDGKRILVDLFWPEGLKTREALVDEWIAELGPTYDLQRFHFTVSNWEEYKSKYLNELQTMEAKRGQLRALADRARAENVTLLYGNRDPKHNHANVLKELIENKAHLTE